MQQNDPNVEDSTKASFEELHKLLAEKLQPGDLDQAVSYIEHLLDLTGRRGGIAMDSKARRIMPWETDKLRVYVAKSRAKAEMKGMADLEKRFPNAARMRVR